jgi:hypothetical protein
MHKRLLLTAALVALRALSAGAIAIEDPAYPESQLRRFPLNEPQLFIDDYFVDNRFNEDSISARVPHVLHTPDRATDPLMRHDADKPWEQHGIGYPSVVFDPDAQLFRLYYQIWSPRTKEPNTPRGGYRVCYAESEDGLTWTKPLMDHVPWGDYAKTNIVVEGKGEGKAPNVHIAQEHGETVAGVAVRNLNLLPQEAFRDNRFLMFYCDHEHFLAGSNDGRTFTERLSMVLPNRVDTHSTLSYDPGLNEYVIYYRNKLVYGDRPKSDPRRGNTRFISRIASKDLWQLWDSMPYTVLIPDADDGGRFYSMPTMRYGGVYLGFVTQFHETPQKIEAELVYSRDGFDWHRLPGRPLLIPVGGEGTWDSGMVFTADRLIEVGDEWWLYYTGHNGYHDELDRVGALGLLKFGKERLVSIQADTSGQTSYVVSRPLVWPGGDLAINANAAGGGFMTVAVTDVQRQPIQGFDHADSKPLTGDAVRHVADWGEADMNNLKGKTIRLEFKFRRADLFAFVAQGDHD